MCRFLYSNANDLWIGNVGTYSLRFFTGGTNSSTERLRITASGSIQLIDPDNNSSGSGIIMPQYVQKSQPTTPQAGNLTIFNRRKGGRNLLAQIGPAGQDTSLQPFLGSNKISYWSHSGNSSAITAPTLFLWNFIHAATNAEGAVTARTVGSGSTFLAGTKRLGYVTTAATNLSVGVYQLIRQYMVGNGVSSYGGFYGVWRFGYNTAHPGDRGFVGFSHGIGRWDLASDPSAIISTTGSSASAGVGFDAADSTWQVMIRATSSAAMTKVNTFVPKPGTGSFYEACIFCPPGNTPVIHFSIEDISLGTSTWSYYGTQSISGAPRPGIVLAPRIWGNSGTNASVLGLDIISMYVETDN